MSKRKLFNSKARERASRLARKAVCYVMTAVMAASTLLGAFAPAAYADSTAYLSATYRILYGGAGTTKFDVDGNEGYCANPSKSTPSSGRYSKSALVCHQPGREWEARADMWFSYGAPGFDPAMWPSTWYDGSGMDADKYRALSHIILADTISSNGHYALYGANASFKSWARQHVIGFGTNGQEINPNATGRQMAKRSGEVPGEDQFQVFLLKTGSATQDIASFTWNPNGKITLRKASANPSCTDGSDLYSVNGAEYGVYSDSGCANKVDTLVTDASGNATSNELRVGTYYVKEIKASEGYALDPTVYTVYVSPGATVSVNGGVVYETPLNDPAGILVGKYDGEKTYTGAGNLPQGSASLAGAEFTVRHYPGFFDTEQEAEASGLTPRTWVFATNENGFIYLPNADAHYVSGDPLYRDGAGAVIVPRGTLVIRETKAPEGYNLNTDFVSVQKVKKPGDTTIESTYNTPKFAEEVKRGGVKVTKLDTQTGSTPQGGANFEGIEFSIINDNENSVVVDGVSYAKGAVVKTIVTDKAGVAQTSSDCLPFGKYVIRETGTNSGYQNSAAYIHAVIGEDGKTYSFTAENKVVRGGVKVSKRDLESSLSTPLGSASIDGTRFDVKTLNDNPVVCDGVTYAKGDVITTLVIKDGEATTSADLLPYGSYSIQEVATGEGYLLTDGTAYEFKIRRHGEIVDGPGAAVKNQVKRGDLEFVKVREDDMSRLAGVPFRITSQTTGESHVIVTDENGQAKTSAEWNKHSHKTNANDSVADERDYDSEAGIWFGLTQEGTMVAPDDALGALPYDTYDIEELPVAANDGLQLVNLEGVVIKRDSVVVDLGTIDDRTETEAYIHTTAHDAADGDKLIAADDQAVITDHVEFTGLTPKWNYVMTATLMDKETGEAIGGPVSKTFTPAGPSGSVEMAIPVDLLEYAGKNVVVFEELTRDGRVVCDHKDLDDTEQTLRVLEPSIGTTAKDGVDGNQQVVIDPETVIVDTVSYKNLVPGREYVVKGELMLKSTGKALEIDGKPVVSEAKFTPEDTHGTVDVPFSFDGSSLAGESVVVFETLYRLDKKIASHADIDDAGQTVEFAKPSIGTIAKDGIDGDQNSATDPEAVIVDTISYKGLVPGKEYTVKGKLMLKSTGKALEIDGKPVVSEAKFTPDDTYGTVDVTFTFDATDLDGESVVVFETLYRLDKKIASHADIDDAGQTVEFAKPSIGTIAKDGVDGDQQAVIDPETVIVDTVSYSGLVVGKEYVVKGKLMDKDTGKALEIDGKPVVSEATFTPEHSSGTVDVSFEFNSSALAGKSVVVFETLYRLDKKIASHADIDDAGQTVEFAEPSIGTTAKDVVDGDKMIVASGKVGIVDIVSYSGLVVGKEYVVKGKLMDKDTGKALEIDGKPVVSEATFTPEHSSGTVDVSFEFDALDLAGRKMVVFETLYRGDDVITKHADIDDAGQTVLIIQPAIDTVALDALDGDKTVVSDADAVITDKVSVEQTIPGVSYAVYGIVMDADTGLPLLSSSAEAEVTDEDLSKFWQAVLDATGIKIVDPLDADAETRTDESRFIDQLLSQFGGVVPFGHESVVDPPAEQPVYFPPFEFDLAKIEAILAEHPAIAERLIVADAVHESDKSAGEIEVSFDFDASDLAGRKAVVCELLVNDDGYAVAAHASLDDADQTVEIVRSTIGTEATDKSDGDHTLMVSKSATIVDTVMYENLIPGREYVVKGILMDKSTGEALLVADKTVEAEKSFIPNKPSGEVEIEFTFDASELDGHEIVVFETLYKDGVEIAAHADLDDAAQTVAITKSPDGTVFDKTGFDRNIVVFAGVSVVIIVAALLAYATVQRHKARSMGEGDEVGDPQEK